MLLVEIFLVLKCNQIDAHILPRSSGGGRHLLSEAKRCVRISKFLCTALCNSTEKIYNSYGKKLEVHMLLHYFVH